RPDRVANFSSHPFPINAALSIQSKVIERNVRFFPNGMRCSHSGSPFGLCVVGNVIEHAWHGLHEAKVCCVPDYWADLHRQTDTIQAPACVQALCGRDQAAAAEAQLLA